MREISINAVYPGERVSASNTAESDRRCIWGHHPTPHNAVPQASIHAWGPHLQIRADSNLPEFLNPLSCRFSFDKRKIQQRLPVHCKLHTRIPLFFLRQGGNKIWLSNPVPLAEELLAIDGCWEDPFSSRMQPPPQELALLQETGPHCIQSGNTKRNPCF